MTDPTDPDRLLRIARQHAQTSRLLGVDVMPIGAQKPEPAVPRKQPDAPNPRPTATAATPEADPGAPAGSFAAWQAPAKPGATLAKKIGALAELRTRYERESEVARNIEGWTNVVFSDGSPDAPLMFIGEAPGADEDQTGIPFTGRSGQKLNEMITAMKLDRRATGQRGVYITSILKVRPPNNRNPTKEEAMHDGLFLEEQIRIVAPKVIVALGKQSASYLLKTDATMGALRGIWHEYEGIPLMPTYHPAYLLRVYTPENRRRVWSDLQMAMARLRELGAIDF